MILILIYLLPIVNCESGKSDSLRFFGHKPINTHLSPIIGGSAVVITPKCK